ncbi:MAG: hypothetical protein NVSMB63_18160 [Sediminibacterium sp.]
MKKCASFLFVFVLFTQWVFAQNDPNAKKVLDALSAKVKSFKTITTTFTIRQFTSRGRNTGAKTGNISVKGQMYILKQGKLEVVSDGNKTYSYDGNKTITVSSAEDAAQTLTPQKILSGSYDKDFTYKLISSKGGFNQIELRPIDPRKNFQKVDVFIDKARNMIAKAVILDKSNNTVQVNFSNLVTNAKLADNLFTFNRSRYPKDVEILD